MILCKRNNYSIRQDKDNCVIIYDQEHRVIYRARYSKKLTADELSEYLGDVLSAKVI